MKTWLIIGVHPTPNGALHLGHIGGPYLTLDILAKYQKTLNNKVFFISGVDSFETHVLLSAKKEKIDVNKICEKYTNQIMEDLKKFSIELDYFIPLHEKDHKKEYFNQCVDIISHLKNHNLLIEKHEKIPLLANKQNEIMPLIGCWLSGECPTCHQDAGSFYCEKCGGHHRPDELKNQKINQLIDIENNDLTRKITSSYFIKANPYEWLRKLLDKNKINFSFKNKFIKDNKNKLIRITMPGRYGVKINIDHSDRENVAFTYTVGLAAFYLMCAHIFMKKFNLSEHPFDSTSSVKTVSAFGFDNSSAYICGLEPIYQALNYSKGIDRYFINSFMNLDNKKFSTSRGHAIWASKLIDATPVESDFYRLYLAKISPIDHETNLDVEDMVDYINLTRNQWVNKINQALNGTAPVSMSVIQQSMSYYLDQYNSLMNDNNFDIRQLVLLIEKLLSNDTEKKQNDINWLIIFIIISYPVLSTLAQKVWHMIGCPDIPNINQLQHLDHVQLNIKPHVFTHCHLKYEDIYKLIGVL